MSAQRITFSFLAPFCQPSHGPANWVVKHLCIISLSWGRNPHFLFGHNHSKTWHEHHPLGYLFLYKLSNYLWLPFRPYSTYNLIPVWSAKDSPLPATAGTAQMPRAPLFKTLLCGPLAEYQGWACSTQWNISAQGKLPKNPNKTKQKDRKPPNRCTSGLRAEAKKLSESTGTVLQSKTADKPQPWCDTDKEDPLKGSILLGTLWHGSTSEWVSVTSLNIYYVLLKMHSIRKKRKLKKGHFFSSYHIIGVLTPIGK